MFSTMQASKIDSIPDTIKHELKNSAICRHGIILQVNSELSLNDSFSIEILPSKTFIIFWFNTIDGSTHIETKIILN